MAGLLACAFVLLLAWSVLLATDDWMWGALCIIGLFLALIRFFLPTDVVLEVGQIILREPLRVRVMPWNSIHICKDGEDALLLIQGGARRRWGLGWGLGRMQVPLGCGTSVSYRKRCIKEALRLCKAVPINSNPAQ